MTTRFEYGVARIKELEVKTRTDVAGRRSVESMSLAGRPVRPSQRFWSSLHHRFGFTSNIFRYFTHEEVFARIATVAPNDFFTPRMSKRGAAVRASAIARDRGAGALWRRDRSCDRA